MIASRYLLPVTLLALTLTAACSRRMPDSGPLTAASDTVIATGEYRPVDVDEVQHLAIEGGTLVVHGAVGEARVDLPAAADAAQQNRGWALVTEGETDTARTLTFTQETSLEDFTLTVPKAIGQVVYGSLGARDGRDLLVFAYGSAPRAYWGYVTIARKG